MVHIYFTDFFVKTLLLEKFFRFAKLFIRKEGANEHMSNKKFQKIVVYAMIIIMLMSSLAFGLSMLA